MNKEMIWASIYTGLALVNGLDLLRDSREVGFDLAAAVCFAVLAGMEWSAIAKRRRQDRRQ